MVAVEVRRAIEAVCARDEAVAGRVSGLGIDPRVTGAQRYSVDAERPGMLHAAFVRSPHAHARVLAVDVSAVPSDCVALTPQDVADLHPYGCQVRDELVIARVARHVGDVVAAVAAPTPEAARAAAALVEVRYEELPAVFDPVEAVAPGAPLAAPRRREVGGRGGLDRGPPAGRHERLPSLPPAPRRHCRRVCRRPTSWSSRPSGRRARRTPRWSRMRRSPSGQTGG